VAFTSKTFQHCRTGKCSWAYPDGKTQKRADVMTERSRQPSILDAGDFVRVTAICLILTEGLKTQRQRLPISNKTNSTYTDLRRGEMVQKLRKCKVTISPSSAALKT
jgi:hypothetical protein